MFCSGCGSTLVPGQVVCPNCGRPTVPPVPPPYPGLALELNAYAGKVRALAIVWFIYGGLSLVMGWAGMAFADAFFGGRFHGWMNGPTPFWFGPGFLHFIWFFVATRSALALIAGWGLLQHTAWGRIVAIVAAFFSILKIPFGTALAIWTLIMLLGYRNSTLYDQLPEGQ